jgi:hypothetical protein
MPKPRITFDHDGRHPLIYMYEPPIFKEEVEAGVDELAGTPVEAIMLTLGDVDTLLYDSRAGQLWGDDIVKWPHHVWRRAHQNFRHLIDQGQDSLQILCDRAHEKGMSLYATLLTQQGGRELALRHWAKEDYENRDMMREVEPLEIGARGGVDPDWPGFRGRDFMHGEVRARNLAVIEEVLANYPVDGIELFMSYQPYHFHPEQVETGREVMTHWIGEVHEAVKRSGNAADGSPRELVVQVPVSLDGALAVGLDVREWIRRDIVDAVTGNHCGFGKPDPNTDFSSLVAAARGCDTRILAAVQSRVNTDRIGESTIQMSRASACNAWSQGVDGLHLSHWFGCWPYKADFYEKLREIAHPDIMAAKDKIYWVSTEAAAPSRPIHIPQTVDALPIEVRENETATALIRISDDLARWDLMGRVHEVLLRVRVTSCSEKQRLRFAFNGRELADSSMLSNAADTPANAPRRVNQMYTMSSPRYRVFGQWFVFRLEGEFWPDVGENHFAMTVLERDPEMIQDVALRDVELEIRYLPGKSFNRGFVDEDLGPYDHASS